jgi:hypothetical protein
MKLFGRGLERCGAWNNSIRDAVKRVSCQAGDHWSLNRLTRALAQDAIAMNDSML